MLGKEDYTEGALAQLANNLVLVESFVLREALRSQDLVVPELERNCVSEVNGSLLRGGALEEQTVAHTISSSWALTDSCLRHLNSLSSVNNALERR